VVGHGAESSGNVSVMPDASRRIVEIACVVSWMLPGWFRVYPHIHVFMQKIADSSKDAAPRRM